MHHSGRFGEVGGQSRFILREVRPRHGRVPKRCEPNELDKAMAELAAGSSARADALNAGFYRSQFTRGF